MKNALSALRDAPEGNEGGGETRNPLSYFSVTNLSV